MFQQKEEREKKQHRLKEGGSTRNIRFLDKRNERIICVFCLVLSGTILGLGILFYFCLTKICGKSYINFTKKKIIYKFYK